jgi:hypothetical protein
MVNGMQPLSSWPLKMHGCYFDPDTRSDRIHAKVIFTLCLPQLRVITVKFGKV